MLIKRMKDSARRPYEGTTLCTAPIYCFSSLGLVHKQQIFMTGGSARSDKKKNVQLFCRPTTKYQQIWPDSFPQTSIEDFNQTQGALKTLHRTCSNTVLLGLPVSQCHEMSHGTNLLRCCRLYAFYFTVLCILFYRF